MFFVEDLRRPQGSLQKSIQSPIGFEIFDGANPTGTPLYTFGECVEWVEYAKRTGVYAIVANARSQVMVVKVYQRDRDDKCVKYVLPGWWIDNDCFHTALQREMEEETGFAMVKPPKFLTTVWLYKYSQGRKRYEYKEENIFVLPEEEIKATQNGLHDTDEHEVMWVDAFDAAAYLSEQSQQYAVRFYLYLETQARINQIL